MQFGKTQIGAVKKVTLLWEESKWYHLDFYQLFFIKSTEMKNMTKYAIEDETEEVENLPEFKQGEVFALSNPE